MSTAPSGETFATAQDLILAANPQTFNGSLSAPFANNFFGRFTLSSRSSVVFSTSTSLAGAESPDIAVLDSTGNLVSLGGNPQLSVNQGAFPNFVNTILDPGTYYVRVFAANSQGATTALSPTPFSLNYQAKAGSAAIEPELEDIAGNVLGTALNLGTVDAVLLADGQPWISQGRYHNRLSNFNPQDYYRFRVSSTAGINFNLALTGLQRNADVQLVQDTNGDGQIDPLEITTAIAVSNRSGNGDEVINRILTAGDYAIRVNRVEGNTSYSLSLVTTPANLLSTGQIDLPLAGEIEVGNLGATPRTYSARLDPTNTLDTYRFTLFDSSNLNLQLTGLTGNADVRLYNSRGVLLQTTSNERPAPEQIVRTVGRTLEAGVYYVQVVPRATGDYTLNLSATASDATSRVSMAADGSEGWGEFQDSFRFGTTAMGSYQPALSADGRYVAFTSYSSNLVAGDVNGQPDVFVRDRLTSEVTLISLGLDGKAAGAGGLNPAISADGRYVAFLSNSANIVEGDTNGKGDVFLRDRLTGTTRRISLATNGTQGNDDSLFSLPAFSADGRFITFTSLASNLVSGDTNDTDNTPFSLQGQDVFVHELATGQTTRVSVASDGTEANGFSFLHNISGDGRYVVFTSTATNLVPGITGSNPVNVFLRDRTTGQTTLVSVAADGTPGNGRSFGHSISADGRYVTFTSNASNLVAGDTNNAPDVFVRDLVTGQTTRVSVTSNGGQSNPTSSFVMRSAISANGRYVVFASNAADLVPGDTNNHTDIFMHDRTTGQTTRLSLGLNGVEANGDSGQPAQNQIDALLGQLAIAADGRYIAYASAATNLVTGDTNNAYDVFVIDQG